MNIFITGGSGFVGGHIIERLDQNHRVFAMARSPLAKQKICQFGATPINCSLENINASHLSGMDAIVHCAGYAEPWGSKQAFYQANVEGTQRLLDAAKHAGIRRFINLSTDSVVFEPGQQLDLDESLPLIERSPYAYCETKMLAERLVTAANSADMLTLSLRPTLIWGPRDTSILTVIKAMAQKGLFVLLDGGEQLISTCHVYNLAQAVVAALHSDRGGEAYFVKDDGDLRIKAWYRHLAIMADVPMPKYSLPSWFAKRIAQVFEWIWFTFKLKGMPPITPFAVALMSSSLTLSSNKIKTELNWQPVITREQGMREMFPNIDLQSLQHA